jgi:hypothetical protein
MSLSLSKIKFKYLLNEAIDPEDLNADNWDDWQEYLKYIEYEIEVDEVNKLINKFKLTKTVPRRLDTLLKLESMSNEVWLEFDPTNNTYQLIKDIEDWIDSMSQWELESALKIDSRDIYNGHLECSLNELSENPGKVYHYTTEEKYNQIQASGLMRMSQGTGITNRQEFGIFTSINETEHADGAYGDVCLTIDLAAFKQGERLAKLHLSCETDVAEYLLRELAYHVIGKEFRGYLSSDMSPTTVIINHNVPSKYVTREFN